MKRPSKKEIQEAVDRLKGHASGEAPSREAKIGKPAAKKSNRRIRKQGV